MNQTVIDPMKPGQWDIPTVIRMLRTRGLDPATKTKLQLRLASLQAQQGVSRSTPQLTVTNALPSPAA